MLLFVGYTLILIIDKVMFDTHALFDDDHDHHGDPAEIKLAQNVRASMMGMERREGQTAEDTRKSMA